MQLVNSYLNFIFYSEMLQKRYFDILIQVKDSKLLPHAHIFIFHAKANFEIQIQANSKAFMKDQ
jgi:hypothetical protein